MNQDERELALGKVPEQKSNPGLPSIWCALYQESHQAPQFYSLLGQMFFICVSVHFTVEAVSGTLPGRGLQQAPDDILTTAPLLRCSIPGSTRRVIRVTTATFLFTEFNRFSSSTSVRLWGNLKDSSKQFTRKPISLPLMASLMGLLADGSREKSTRMTIVSTP